MFSQNIKCFIARNLPRIKALAWAGFLTSRAAAYLTTTPRQLGGIAEMVPAGALWMPWLIAALLLTAGGLVPASAGERSQSIARALRISGIALATMILLMWGAAFFAYGARGWVTGTTFLFLAVVAAIMSYTLGQTTVEYPPAPTASEEGPAVVEGADDAH